MAFLEVKDLKAFYGKAQALNDISFSMERGDCVGVIGPNGAGKSTLLRTIIGRIKWEGQIIFDGVDLHKLNSTQIVRLKIGYAPERGHLFPFMNVRDNLLVGAYSSRENIDENLSAVFELFPILKERQKQEAKTLSGGERQMLCLGRALMSSPRLLLVDEPTLGLAPIVISSISDAVEKLKKTGVTILIAEQNVSFTLTHSERIYLLERGGFTMSGTPEELKGEEYVRKTYFGI
jgi:branched-chain amino acid transport system ATP-binding protein